MLTKCEIGKPSADLRRDYQKALDSDQMVVVDRLTWLSIELVVAFTHMHDYLDDIPDGASCGPTPSTCGSSTGSEVKCPACGMRF